MEQNIPFPSEQFIEDFVFNKIITEKKCPISGNEVALAFRQVNLGAYGIIDILKVNFETLPSSEEFNISFSILELKNQPLRPGDLAQLHRYKTGLNRYLSEIEGKFFNFNGLSFEVYTELAGTGFSDDLVYLITSVDTNFYELSCSVDAGFKSKCRNSGYYNPQENKLVIYSVISEITSYFRGMHVSN